MCVCGLVAVIDRRRFLVLRASGLGEENETEVEVSRERWAVKRWLGTGAKAVNRSGCLYAPIAGQPQHVRQGVRGRQGLAFDGNEKGASPGRLHVITMLGSELPQLDLSRTAEQAESCAMLWTGAGGLCHLESILLEMITQGKSQC